MFRILLVDFFQVQSQGRQWRSQLMGGIGREPPFPFQGLVEASEQAIHRLHQTGDLLRCLAVVQGMNVFRSHVPYRLLKLSQRLEAHLN